MASSTESKKDVHTSKKESKETNKKGISSAMKNLFIKESISKIVTSLVGVK